MVGSNLGIFQAPAAGEAATKTESQHQPEGVILDFAGYPRPRQHT